MHEIQRDGAIELLMPVEFRSGGISEAELRKRIAWTGNSLRYTRYNAEFLRRIADDLKATFVPFPQDELTASQWAGVMHLGPDGSLTKARYVASFVSQALGDAHSRDRVGRRRR